MMILLIDAYVVAEGKTDEHEEWMKSVGIPTWEKDMRVKSVRYFSCFVAQTRPPQEAACSSSCIRA
jgi:hypothetical protein